MSWMLLPAWPREWLHRLAFDLAHAMHAAPLLATTGPLFLLAAPRWRRPGARLLLAMALVPQKIFYDPLPPPLVARRCGSRSRSHRWAASRHSSWRVATTTDARREHLAVPYVTLGVHLPALILELRHARAARVARPRRVG